MSRSGPVDVSILQPTLDTGVQGLRQVVKFLESGTTEIKKILLEECDVVYECKVCRNFFRSIVNFVSHKRTYCRSHFANVDAASPQQNQASTESSHSNSDSSAEQTEDAEQTIDGPILSSSPTDIPDVHKQASQKLLTTLVPSKKAEFRRRNLVQTLSRRLSQQPAADDDSENGINDKNVPKTTFKDGVQIVVSAPRLAEKEKISEAGDETVMVVPEGYERQKLNMELRIRSNRKQSYETVRHVTSDECELIDRLSSYGKVDIGNFSCCETECIKQKRLPFEDVRALALHVSCFHPHTDDKGQHIPFCIECNYTYSNRWCFKTHVKKLHCNVRIARRKYKESKGIKIFDRANSLSPISTPELTEDNGNNSDDNTEKLELNSPMEMKLKKSKPSAKRLKIGIKNKATAQKILKRNLRLSRRKKSRLSEAVSNEKEESQVAVNTTVNSEASDLSTTDFPGLKNVFENIRANSDGERNGEDIEIPEEVDFEQRKKIVDQVLRKQLSEPLKTVNKDDVSTDSITEISSTDEMATSQNDTGNKKKPTDVLELDSQSPQSNTVENDDVEDIVEDVTPVSVSSVARDNLAVALKRVMEDSNETNQVQHENEITECATVENDSPNSARDCDDSIQVPTSASTSVQSCEQDSRSPDIEIIEDNVEERDNNNSTALLVDSRVIVKKSATNVIINRRGPSMDPTHPRFCWDGNRFIPDGWHGRTFVATGQKTIGANRKSTPSLPARAAEVRSLVPIAPRPPPLQKAPDAAAVPVAAPLMAPPPLLSSMPSSTQPPMLTSYDNIPPPMLTSHATQPPPIQLLLITNTETPQTSTSTATPQMSSVETLQVHVEPSKEPTPEEREEVVLPPLAVRRLMSVDFDGRPLKCYVACKELWVLIEKIGARWFAKKNDPIKYILKKCNETGIGPRTLVDKIYDNGTEKVELIGQALLVKDLRILLDRLNLSDPNTIDMGRSKYANNNSAVSDQDLDDDEAVGITERIVDKNEKKETSRKRTVSVSPLGKTVKRRKDSIGNESTPETEVSPRNRQKRLPSWMSLYVVNSHGRGDKMKNRQTEPAATYKKSNYDGKTYSKNNQEKSGTTREETKKQIEYPSVDPKAFIESKPSTIPQKQHQSLCNLKVRPTDMQKKLLTQSLHTKGDTHICRHCNERFSKMEQGRRHIMKHLNMIRFQCSYCLAGSFFCADMRIHLKTKVCPKMTKDGPVMTDDECDQKTLLADEKDPGAVVFWQGKIISHESPDGQYPIANANVYNS